jgi:anti-anti-sigma regulatory factor
VETIEPRQTEARGDERVLVVPLEGRLTGGSDVRLLDAVTRAAGLSRALALDVASIGSIDLGGACSLVKLLVWAERTGTRVGLFGAGASVRHALKITGLAGAVPLFRTEAEALAALRAEGRPPPPSALPDGGEATFDSSWGWAATPRGSAPKASLAARRAVGPMDGFGPLWENVHRVRLTGAPDDPEDIAEVWRREFAAFWPPGNAAAAPAGLDPPGSVD